MGGPGGGGGDNIFFVCVWPTLNWPISNTNKGGHTLKIPSENFEQELVIKTK